MTSENLPSSHPVFDYSFIEDPYLYYLTYQVMEDPNKDATPVGGLNGREVSSRPPFFIAKLIYIVQIIILKIWHWMKLSFLCGYKEKFWNAALKITDADLQNQQRRIELLEIRRQEELLQVAELEEKERKNHAVTLFQSCYRVKRIRKPFLEVFKAAKLVSIQKNILAAFKDNLDARREAVTQFSSSKNIYERLPKQSRFASAVLKPLSEKISPRLAKHLIDPGAKAKKTMEFHAESIQSHFSTDDHVEVLKMIENEQQLLQEKTQLLGTLEQDLIQKKKIFWSKVASDEQITDEQSKTASIQEITRDLFSSTPDQLMLNDVERYVHPNAARVWKMLFDKITNKEKFFKSWTFDEASKVHTLKLFKWIQMWTPTLDDNNVPESEDGSVLLFGKNEAHKIEIKFDAQTKKMEFIKGLDVCFSYRALVKVRDIGTILYWQCPDNDNIGFAVQYMGTRVFEKSMRNYEVNWQERGEIVTGDCFDILKSHAK